MSNRCDAKTTGAAGVVLRLALLNSLEDQDVLDGDLENETQRQQVVGAGEGLTALPLVDGLRGIETEVVLEVGDGETLLLPETLDVDARGDHVDDGEGLESGQENRSFRSGSSGWLVSGGADRHQALNLKYRPKMVTTATQMRPTAVVPCQLSSLMSRLAWASRLMLGLVPGVGFGFMLSASLLMVRSLGFLLTFPIIRISGDSETVFQKVNLTPVFS